MVIFQSQFLVLSKRNKNVHWSNFHEISQWLFFFIIIIILNNICTKFLQNKPHQSADKMKPEGCITLLTTCWGHALNISQLFSLSTPSSIWTFDVFVPHSILRFFFFFTSSVEWLRNNPPLFAFHAWNFALHFNICLESALFLRWGRSSLIKAEALRRAVNLY